MNENIIPLYEASFREDRQQNGRQSINTKPWLNENGMPRPDNEIKELCKSWDAAIWEEYLTTLESSFEEVLFHKKHSVEMVSEQQSFFNFLLTNEQQNMYPQLASLAKVAVDKLSPGEAKALRLTFWEGLSQYEIAQFLGQSRSTVRTQINRGLEKLRKIFKHPQISKNLIRLNRYKKFCEKSP